MSGSLLPTESAGTLGSQSTSLSLITRMQVQSPDAWRIFVEIYGPLIYRWCRRMGVARGDAADVSQEVFRSVARMVGQFHRNQLGDSFRGWLYTITKNKVRDFQRAERFQPQAFGGTDAQLQFGALVDPVVPGEMESHDSRQMADDKKLLVTRVLERLRSEFGQTALAAFWRMVVDGDPAADIGRDLEMTSKAVRQAKYRVLQRIRAELRDFE